MNRRVVAIVLLIPFGLLTVLALQQYGYVGILNNFLHNSAGWQGFADLIIALLLVLSWMYSDAKKHGRKFWPYLGITLFTGSFGPLLYLLFSPKVQD